MFEVHIFTPKHFGAFIPWLLIHRGSLSVPAHPNTGDEQRDHTQVSFRRMRNEGVQDLTKNIWLHEWDRGWPRT